MNVQREFEPVFHTSNHSDSDQSKIEDGDVLKTESLITFWHDKSPIEPQVLRQIFINWQQLLNLGGERSIWIARRTQNWRERLRWKTDWSKTFRWHAAHFSVTVSYRKHTWKHETQSGSLSHCMTWRTTSCTILFLSHSACVPRMRLWVLKICRCEFGYRMRLSRPLKTVLCVNEPYKKKKSEKSDVTFSQVWWPILGIRALHLTHPKCTHTAVNTHTHSREHTHTQPWTHTHTAVKHTHTQPWTHTHTAVNTHTHSREHTHTQPWTHTHPEQ